MIRGEHEHGPEAMEVLRLQVEHMASSERLNVPDIFQRAFFQALLPRLDNPEYPVLNGLIAQSLIDYPDRTAKNLADNIQRSDNNYNLRHNTPGWPAGHNVPAAKTDFFEALETDPEEQQHFTKNIELNVQTNIPDRGVLLKAAALMLGHTGPLKMLDIGCSRHHISKKLAAPEGSSHGKYRHVDVMESIHDTEADHQASQRFNQLVNGTKLPIASSIGIDLQDMIVGETKRDHDKHREWARSCFYTSEYYYDSDRIQQFDYWEEASIPEVKFFQGDITSFDHDKFANFFPGARQYDISYFSTVAYQLGEAGMRTAIENVKQYLRPNGLILLQDFVQVDDNGSMEFLTTDWPKGSYSMYGLDLSRQEEGFKKYFSVASGRIGRVALEPQLLTTPIAQHLEFGTTEK